MPLCQRRKLDTTLEFAEFQNGSSIEQEVLQGAIAGPGLDMLMSASVRPGFRDDAEGAELVILYMLRSNGRRRGLIWANLVNARAAEKGRLYSRSQK